jgi:hypothetical protein
MAMATKADARNTPAGREQVNAKRFIKAHIFIVETRRET